MKERYFLEYSFISAGQWQLENLQDRLVGLQLFKAEWD